MKQRTCRYCKQKYTPKAPLQNNCMTGECFDKFIEKNKITFEKKQVKERKEKRAILRDKTKTISQYKKDAKTPFQKYIRMRDNGKPCISCGVITNKIDGGHYKKAELYYGVIFDEDNCHAQCRKCNRYLGGNEANYRNGLVERYGVKYVENLEQKAIETKEYMHSKDELIEIKKKYQQKIKNYE